MTVDHRRPLIAFIVVSVLCAFVLVNGLVFATRSDVGSDLAASRGIFSGFEGVETTELLPEVVDGSRLAEEPLPETPVGTTTRAQVPVVQAIQDAVRTAVGAGDRSGASRSSVAAPPRPSQSGPRGGRQVGGHGTVKPDHPTRRPKPDKPGKDPTPETPGTDPKPDTPGQGPKSDTPGKGPKSDKPGKGPKSDKPEKAPKPGKAAKQAKAPKAEKPAKPEKAPKPDKPQKTKPEKAPKPDKPQKSKPEKAPKPDKPGKAKGHSQGPSHGKAQGKAKGKGRH